MTIRLNLKLIVMAACLFSLLLFGPYAPSHAEDTAVLKPSPGNAMLHIFRQDDGLHSNIVYVDGIKVSSQHSGEIISVEVAPGSHEIKVYVFNEWNGEESDKLNLVVKLGDIKFLECVTTEHPNSSRAMYLDIINKDKDTFQLVTEKLNTGSLFSLIDNEVKSMERDYNVSRSFKTENIVSPSQVTKRPTAIVPTAKNAITNKYGIAVIIGNRNYSDKSTDVPNVDFAHKDADAIYKYVTESLGYRDGNIIYLKDASQAELLSAFGNDRSHEGKLFNWLRPDKSDVFVYYSGHGVPGMSDGKGYLLPVDADPVTVEINGYPLETLYNNLAKIPARSVTVLLDACFSGSSAGGSVLSNASSITLRVSDTKPLIKNGVVLTASGANEVASWDKQAQMGLFTKNFLDGVSGLADGEDFGDGDGVVTLQELKTFMQSEVTYAARRTYGRKQSPQFYGNLNREFTSPN